MSERERERAYKSHNDAYNTQKTNSYSLNEWNVIRRYKDVLLV